MPAGVSPNGSLNVAGILGPDDALTPASKDKFITEVENEMIFGTPSISFPCGDVIVPSFGAQNLDLHNEVLYPAFHQNWVLKYENVARAFNIQRGPGLFLPILDPTIMLSPLPNVDFELLLKLLPMPIPPTPDFILALGKLGIDISLPDLTAIIALPGIPDFSVNVDLKYPLDWNIPHVAFQLALLLELPNLILQFINMKFFPFDLPTLLAKVCETIRKNVFKSQYTDDTEGVDLLDLAASMVLARNVAKLMTLSVVCTMVGSGGIVNKGAAAKLDMIPKEEPAAPPSQVTHYDLDQPEFWDNYVMMCNRIEIDPMSLAQICQFEGQWTPFKKNLQESKAMGFIQIMPWIFQGNNTSASWPRGLRMRPEYWQKLYDEDPEASRHASDDLFWTEQFFINGIMGSFGKTLAEFKGNPVKLYDTVINPQLNKIPATTDNPYPPRFTGATVNPTAKLSIEAAMARVGSQKGNRLPQPDGLKSAFIDWTTVSQEDVLAHPYYASDENQHWWQSLPEMLAVPA